METVVDRPTIKITAWFTPPHRPSGLPYCTASPFPSLMAVHDAMIDEFTFTSLRWVNLCELRQGELRQGGGPNGPAGALGIYVR